jgi:hypothetical protein
MGIADELIKLERLRQSGTLTEAEFAAAKSSVLEPAKSSVLEPAKSSVLEPATAVAATPVPTPLDESLGRTANRYVNFQIISGVIGAIVVIFVLIAILGGSGPFTPFDDPVSPFSP